MLTPRNVIMFDVSIALLVAMLALAIYAIASKRRRPTRDELILWGAMLVIGAAGVLRDSRPNTDWVPEISALDFAMSGAIIWVSKRTARKTPPTY